MWKISSFIIALATTPTWAFHSIGDGTVPSGNTRSFFESLGTYLGATNRVNDSYVGGLDMTVSFDSGTKTWKWLNGMTLPAGANSGIPPAFFTQFADGSHNSWTRTYDDERLWDWLFCQQKL